MRKLIAITGLAGIVAIGGCTLAAPAPSPTVTVQPAPAKTVIVTQAPPANAGPPAQQQLTQVHAGLWAGPNTSGPFAEAVEQAWLDSGGGNTALWVHSPVTGQDYLMTYIVAADGSVSATGGNNAYVLFH
jgi:hypothetical protein